MPCRRYCYHYLYRSVKLVITKCKLIVLTAVLGFLFINFINVMLDMRNRTKRHRIAALLHGNYSMLQSDVQLMEAFKHYPELKVSKEEGQMSKGEELALRIRQKCSLYLSNQPRMLHQLPVSINAEHKLLFCPICKVGSTYWTRFFKFLEIRNVVDILLPYQVPIAQAPPTKTKIRLLKGVARTAFDNFFKFVFVRDPYARLLSAYVDKLFAPNPTFWRGVNSDILKRARHRRTVIPRCGADLTFEEYIQGVVLAHSRKHNAMLDCHDASFVARSHPCEANYNFVGKMESFRADSLFIYRRFGLNKSAVLLEQYGALLADEDALLDTVESPFKWKPEITKCIPWKEALKRIWKKLQIRGVIGKDEFPLTMEQTEIITKNEFMNLIKDTQTKTPLHVRKLQRKEALVEIYRNVSLEVLHKLRHVYQADFEVFEYDKEPDYIFNRNNTRESVNYGYLNL